MPDHETASGTWRAVLPILALQAATAVLLAFALVALDDAGLIEIGGGGFSAEAVGLSLGVVVVALVFTSWSVGRRVAQLASRATSLRDAGDEEARTTREAQREAARLLADARDRDELLRAAASALPGGIVRSDLRSGRVERSEGLLRMLGLAPGGDEPALGWWLERIHPDDVALVTERRERALYGEGDGFEVAYRMRHADGRFVDVEQRTLIERDASGRAVRTIGTILDVSDRRAASAVQERLGREASERSGELEAVYEALPLGMALVDSRMRVRRANARFLRFCVAGVRSLDGGPPGSGERGLLGEKVDDVLGPACHEITAAAGEVLAGGEGRRIEAATNPDDADTRVIIARAYPVTIGGERGAGLVLEDASERRRAERLLRERDERLRRLTESGIIGFMLTNGDLVRDANDVLLSLFGRTRTELESGAINWREATAPADREADARAVRELAERGTCAPFEKTIRAPNGEERAVLFGAATAEPGASAYVCFVLDISERRQREQHVRFLMRELSHRTNNLLAVVQGIARQTLAGATDLSDFEPRFTGRLQSLAESQRLLVRQDYRGVALSDLVPSQLRMPVRLPERATDGEDEAGKTARVVLDAPPLFLTPEAAQHIGLALHELATNARRFGALSTPEGHILIEASIDAGPDAPPRVRLRWRELGGPPVAAPTRRGFGSVVTERLVGSALEGQARLHHRPDGVVWELDVPASQILLSDGGAAPLRPAEAEAASTLGQAARALGETAH